MIYCEIIQKQEKNDLSLNGFCVHSKWAREKNSMLVFS